MHNGEPHDIGLTVARYRAIVKAHQAKGGEQMNDNEIPRLIEWLRDHGHTDEEIIECIYFVTKGKRLGE